MFCFNGNVSDYAVFNKIKTLGITKLCNIVSFVDMYLSIFLWSNIISIQFTYYMGKKIVVIYRSKNMFCIILEGQ